MQSDERQELMGQAAPTRDASHRDRRAMGGTGTRDDPGHDPQRQGERAQRRENGAGLQQHFVVSRVPGMVQAPASQAGREVNRAQSPSHVNAFPGGTMAYYD